MQMYLYVYNARIRKTENSYEFFYSDTTSFKKGISLVGSHFQGDPSVSRGGHFGCYAHHVFMGSRMQEVGKDRRLSKVALIALLRVRQKACSNYLVISKDFKR